MRIKTASRRYLLSLVVAVMLLCGLGLAVNYVVDPLMFVGGNRLFDRNYVFNERLSKVAYYQPREGDIDCLILGSSRMTYLDGRGLYGRDCANYAFSGGQPAEILSYLNYLKARGVRPRIVLVGIDELGAANGGEGVPDFVRLLLPMSGSLSYYFSLDTLRFSLQSLMGVTRSPNFYDAALRKHVGYKLRTAGQAYPDRFYLQADDVAEDSTLAVYRRMPAVFPDARWIGLIPPTSQWSREKLQSDPLRERYVAAVLALATVFDELFDYSRLPDDCMDYSDSYDGIHYSARVWDHYAQRLTGGDDAGRIKGPAMLRSRDELLEYYRQLAVSTGCQISAPVQGGAASS